MLLKLQKKTILPLQLIGYFLTLLIGTTIIFTVFQLYLDSMPLIHKESDVFKKNAAVVTKEISVFKTVNKDKIYFSKDDIAELEEQHFIENISKFNTATFEIKAFSNESEDILVFYTDLFFESIPNDYLDVETEDWVWSEDENFLPIIIPENYLNLYNFGFAESQGLPVISKNTISEISFNIKISGNGKSKVYRSRIVGFSNKINSILVPQNFLIWANQEFGRTTAEKTNRLLIEFKNPSDENILKYFNNNNLSIAKNDLEFSKLIFFFKTAIIFVFAVAIIIVVLSIAFILLSINLILQKNKEMIVNLYNIGFSVNRISKFYQILVCGTTMISVGLALILSFSVRNFYTKKLNMYFEYDAESSKFVFLAIVFILVILPFYILIIKNSIAKIATQKRA